MPTPRRAAATVSYCARSAPRSTAAPKVEVSPSVKHNTAVRVPAALLEGRDNDAIALGVRPEKIRMIDPSKDVPGGLNRVAGTVTHASYLGVSTQYIVTLADGHRVTVFEQNVERATKSELWNADAANSAADHGKK